MFYKIVVVVLLMAAFLNKIENPPGEVGLGVGVGHGDVGHMLPGLIGHPRDDLQHFEFAERPATAVEQIHGEEKQARQ